MTLSRATESASAGAGIDDEFDEFFAAGIVEGVDFFVLGAADEDKNGGPGQADARRGFGFEKVTEGNHWGSRRLILPHDLLCCKSLMLILF